MQRTQLGVGFTDINAVRSYLYDGKDDLKFLPAGTIVGQATLNKEQYERQLKIAHSAYNAILPGNSRIFVGLNSIDPDEQHAHYYWLLNWNDPTAGKEDSWTSTATKEELLNFTLEQTEVLDSHLNEIVRLTRADDIMMPPLVLRDIILENMPNRRVTLLGDAAHAMAPRRSNLNRKEMY